MQLNQAFYLKTTVCRQSVFYYIPEKISCMLPTSQNSIPKMKLIIWGGGGGWKDRNEKVDYYILLFA